MNMQAQKQNMPIQNTNGLVSMQKPLTETETREQTIGSTTYIVNSSFDSNSREGLADKVVRLIKNAPSSI